MIPEDAIWILELIRNRDARTEAEKDAVNAAIEALKAQLSQEGTTSDLISRQAAIEKFAMTAPQMSVIRIYEAVEILESMPTIQLVATDTNVGSNSEIPNSSDTISRQAAVDALSMMQGIVAENGVRKGISMAWQQIEDLPPAQPERAAGEWIVHLYKVGVSRYECDTCHARCDIIYPYCPYCGEKKEGERNAFN